MDKEKQVWQRIWITVGVTVFLLIALVVGSIQFLIKPKVQEIAKQSSVYQTQLALANRLPEVLATRQKAQDNQKYLEDQLAFFRQRYRSLFFGNAQDPNLKPEEAAAIQQTAWRRWMNEYFNDYGLSLKDELLSAAEASGVALKSDIKVGAPPRAPEEVAVPTNGLFKPTGGPLKMSVTGSLSNIIQFFNRINQSSILMLIDRDLKLEGTSPNITATFSLTPYLLATGGGAPITVAAAAGGTSGDPALSGAYPSSGSSGASPAGSSSSASPGPSSPAP